VSLRLTWLGHSTIVLEGDGARILTDPLLGRHSGPLRRRGPAPTPGQWRQVDAVLLSHLHHDHAHLATLRTIDAPVVTAAVNARFLRRHGVTRALDPGDDWYDVRGTAARVRLTRADHRHRPMPHRPNAANGHLVRVGGVRVWIAGDTALFDAMAAIPDLAGGPIDLAVVPIGGWGPRLSGGHLDPADAAEACRLVGAATAIPYHWGTFHLPGAAERPAGWMSRPGEQFPAELARHAPGCRPLVLAPGESVEL
jgi:L-ascorbate metabolism protein UlaG (beta-lactamase superfamily)